MEEKPIHGNLLAEMFWKRRDNSEGNATFALTAKMAIRFLLDLLDARCIPARMNRQIDRLANTEID